MPTPALQPDCGHRDQHLNTQCTVLLLVCKGGVEPEDSLWFVLLVVVVSRGSCEVGLKTVSGVGSHLLQWGLGIKLGVVRFCELNYLSGSK